MVLPLAPAPLKERGQCAPETRASDVRRRASWCLQTGGSMVIFRYIIPISLERAVKDLSNDIGTKYV